MTSTKPFCAIVRGKQCILNTDSKRHKKATAKKVQALLTQQDSLQTNITLARQKEKRPKKELILTANLSNQLTTFQSS